MSAGSILTAEDLAFMVDPPRAELMRNSTQAVSGNSAVIWNTAINDAWGFWDSSSPTLIVPTVAGRYDVKAYVQWLNASDSTQRTTRIDLNGTPTYQVQGPALNGGSTQQIVAAEVVVNGTNDFISIIVGEGASGSVTVNVAGISLRWVAPS